MRRLLWTLPGVVLLAAGVVILLTRGADVDEFGWFAYTPLSDDHSVESSAGSLLLLTHAQATGWVLVALGLAALTAYAGFLVGRRTSR